MGKGYIAVFRQLTEWGWYKDLPVCKLWLHILLRANYKPLVFMGERLERGQFATSVKTLSAETGLSAQQIRTALKKLEKTGEITVKTNTKYTTITVIGYDRYQNGIDLENEEQQQTNNKRITNEQQTNNRRATNEQQQEKERNKEIREEELKERKKRTPPAVDLAERYREPVLSAARDWLDYKRERGEGYKPTGLKSLLTQIDNRIALHGEQAVADVIRLSMSNGWRGIIWDRVQQARPQNSGSFADVYGDW